MTSLYRTNELEIASFLKAKGHNVKDPRIEGHIVSFGFDPSAAADVDNYFRGIEVPARNLFEAHRALRALIQQLKQHHTQQRNGEHNAKTTRGLNR